MLIAIPSMGRPGNCSTYFIIKECGVEPTFFVPASQAMEYEKFYPSVVPVPDSIKGITRARNFILDYVKSIGEKYIVQLDDDAHGFYKFEAGGQAEKINERAVIHFERMFTLAEELGTVLWGLQLNNDPKTYREYAPFSFSSTCVASCFGMIECGLRFDENLRLKEDYDYSLQVLKKYRKILRSNKYIWYVKHQTLKGGCANYRTIQAEHEAIEYLQRKWGKHIITRNPKKDYEIVVRPPIRGI